MACALDAWLGEVEPLEMGEAVLLHVADEDIYRTLATSPRLRPFLGGRTGKGWLVVKKDKREELAALLGELGFTLGQELTPRKMPRGEGEEVPRKRRRR
jgi:hypothetical protein